MMKQLPEHVAFSELHHELVGFVEFPHDEIFDRLDGTCPTPTPQTAARARPDDAMALAGDGLYEILRWVWRRGRMQRRSPTTAFPKYLSLDATPESARLQTDRQ